MRATWIVSFVPFAIVSACASDAARPAPDVRSGGAGASASAGHPGAGAAGIGETAGASAGHATAGSTTKGGGPSAGGSSAGGSHVGGSSAGGSHVGGSSVGGAAASGGSAAGGSPVSGHAGASGSSGASGAPASGNVSGLGWVSGAGTSDVAAFEAWRGHPLDVFETWPNRGNWNELQNPDIYGAVSAFKGLPGALQIGVAMLPEDKSATFAECAKGTYDKYYESVGQHLSDVGRGDAFVRLGWEANGDWFAWSIRDQADDYKACFRSEAKAIRKTAPQVRIDWNMNRDSHSMTVVVTDAYPGDDVVDVVGVDWYDAWPAAVDEATWDKLYLQKDSLGGPVGIGAWFAFAQSHGKPLSVPEWNVENKSTDPDGSGGTDNPFYVQKCTISFAANAAHIAYESVFNEAGYRDASDPHSVEAFVLYPPTTPHFGNPLSAAKYQSLF